jgi:hypothetical protein
MLSFYQWLEVARLRYPQSYSHTGAPYKGATPRLMKGLTPKDKAIFQRMPPPDAPKGSPLGQYFDPEGDYGIPYRQEGGLERAKKAGFIEKGETTEFEKRIIIDLELWVGQWKPIPCEDLEYMISLAKKGLYENYFKAPQVPVYRGTLYPKEAVMEAFDKAGKEFERGKPNIPITLDPSSFGDEESQRCDTAFSKNKIVAEAFWKGAAKESKKRENQDQMAILVTADPRQNKFIDLEPFMQLFVQGKWRDKMLKEEEVLGYGRVGCTLLVAF